MTLSRFKDWLKAKEDWLILLSGSLLAIGLRYALRDFESGDFRNFTGPWYDALAAGGFQGLKDVPSNYSPTYLYLLLAASSLAGSLPKLYAIKLISIVFDFVCAAFVYKLVRLKYARGIMPLFSFFAVLFAPTVFLNSSFWGQADVLYTAGLAACLYFLLTERQALAFFVFALAFSVKLQALFLAPLLLVLLIRGKVPWKNVLLIPATYLLTLVPAWLAGRPLLDLLTTYLGQADFYRALTKNAPNLYQWLPNSQYDILMPTGLLFAVAFVFLLVLAAYRSRAAISRDLIVYLGMFSVLVMPFLLPKMHDRYFFAADVFSILFVFYYPKHFYVPFVVVGVSFFTYLPFLFGQEPIPLSYLALVLLILIAILGRQLARELRLDQV